MRFGAKPQSVDRGRRSQLAQTNHSQPACKLQVRADSRDCSYRQAWLSAGPCGQAQQARRPPLRLPSTWRLSPAQLASARTRRPLVGRIVAWTPSLTGGIVVVRDPCLHGRFSIGSLCVGPSDTMSWSPTIGLLITPQEPIQPRLGGRVERFLNTFRTEVVVYI